MLRASAQPPTNVWAKILSFIESEFTASTMKYENVLLTLDGDIARVTINRPDKRNALNTQTLDELADALTVCDSDAAVRVVILSGAGDKAFCAGADLAETQANRTTPEYAPLRRPPQLHSPF